MGKPDLFAKRTLASQTEPLTNGAASWREAPEIGLEKVQSDGIIVIHDAVALKNLAAPWNLPQVPDEILLENKMQGDHLDRPVVSRILLRRQAREVQRIDEGIKRKTPWLGSQTIWVASGYLPDWVKQRYCPAELAPGCFRWASEHFEALWIASNELPLRDELVPFLITRTGRPLLEFLNWVVQKKSWQWVEDLLYSLGMLPQEAYDFIKYRYPLADEESKRNVQSWIAAFVEEWPELKVALTLSTRQEMEDALTAYAEKQKALQQVEKAQREAREAKAAQEAAESALREAAREVALKEAAALRTEREMVVQTLELRKLPVRPEQLAQVETCTDRAQLRRWHHRAVVAASADEVFAVDKLASLSGQEK